MTRVKTFVSDTFTYWTLPPSKKPHDLSTQEKTLIPYKTQKNLSKKERFFILPKKVNHLLFQ